MGYVFISYSHKNRAEADALRNIFKRNGIDCRMDDYDIRGGSKWGDAIVDIIENDECTCLVLVLSKESQNSNNVNNEVMIAKEKNKCIFPIQIEQFELKGNMKFQLIGVHITYIRNFDENDSIIKKIISDIIFYSGTATTNFLSGKKYLNNKMYHNALECFEKAIDENPNNSDSYFYAAVCLLEGRIAFDHLRPEINKIIEYLNVAIQIKNKGIYYYFLAYIKKDYFDRKYLNYGLNYKTYLDLAYNNNLRESEIIDFYALLDVNRPDGL